MCTDARQYAMQQQQQQQQQGNVHQQQYHHQPIPNVQMQQYQQAYGMNAQQNQAHLQMQDRSRQVVPNEQINSNIYQQQIPPGLPQNLLYHQQQIQNHYALHPLQRTSPPTNQQLMASQVNMHPQSQANIYIPNNSAIMSGAATLRRPPVNQTAMVRDPMEAIPNPNMMDGVTFERDKQQVYKCSTLRQGGKFDPRNFGPRQNMTNGLAPQNIQTPPKPSMLPSILNCPLPEIPKEIPPNPNDSNNAISPRNLNNLNTNGAPNMNQPIMTR